MDDVRFDSLTKVFGASAGTRRGVVRGAAAGLTGLVLGAGSVQGKKRKKKKCKRPKVKCGKKCVDPRTDITNCGGCGRVCDLPSPRCQQGVCLAGTCPTTADFCGLPDEFVPCELTCGCATSIQGGAICADFVSCPALGCDSDQDCVDGGYGAGSVCIDASGPNCGCSRGCATPCPI